MSPHYNAHSIIIFKKSVFNKPESVNFQQLFDENLDTFQSLPMTSLLLHHISECMRRILENELLFFLYQLANFN